MKNKNLRFQPRFIILIDNLDWEKSPVDGVLIAIELSVLPLSNIISISKIFY